MSHPSSVAVAQPPTWARAFVTGMIQRGTTSGGDDAEPAFMEHACTQIPGTLARWFGTRGSRALVAQALLRAQADHPAIAVVAVAADDAPCLAGMPDAVRAAGTAPVAAGIIAMLEELTHLLGRLIGDDLAMNLLEQSAGRAITPPATGNIAE
jgi:hypothetical protein